MNIFRSEKNPIIKPGDVKPSRADFKVVGVFNCGVARFKGEILLLMRVAETPINNNPKKECVPLLDVKAGKLVVKELSKSRFFNRFFRPQGYKDTLPGITLRPFLI